MQETAGVRLYLSSYRLGEHPESFARLVQGRQRGWIIANALDALDEQRRHRDTRREIDELAQLGLRAQDLDLREHDPASLARAFGDPDFLWVRGGNVFTLRAAMARSGFDRIVVRGLRADSFVYAGYSAGACVLAPDLTGLERCDSPTESAAVYGAARYDGLGILDRPVVPHLASRDHPETAVLTEVAAEYDRKRQPYWALRDGQALLIDGSTPAIR